MGPFQTLQRWIPATSPERGHWEQSVNPVSIPSQLLDFPDLWSRVSSLLCPVQIWRSFYGAGQGLLQEAFLDLTCALGRFLLWASWRENKSMCRLCGWAPAWQTQPHLPIYKTRGASEESGPAMPCTPSVPAHRCLKEMHCDAVCQGGHTAMCLLWWMDGICRYNHGVIVKRGTPGVTTLISLPEHSFWSSPWVMDMRVVQLFSVRISPPSPVQGGWYISFVFVFLAIFISSLSLTSSAPIPLSLAPWKLNLPLFKVPKYYWFLFFTTFALPSCGFLDFHPNWVAPRCLLQR